MKTTMNQPKTNVHYGKEVLSKLESRGMSKSEFAKRIKCSRNNVYNIFNREDVDLRLLRRISEVLDFDFIHDL